MYGTGSNPLNCDNYVGAIVYAQSFHVDPDYDFNLIPARSVQPASVMRLRETVLLWKQIFFRRNCVICAVLPILLAAGKQPPGKAKLQAIGQACDIRLRYKRKVKLKTQITARFKTYI